MHRTADFFVSEPGATRGSAAETSYPIAPRWQERAACRDVEPRIFWPEGGDYSAAAKVCSRCPVIGECLENADWGEEAVFRAGLTGVQRKNLRRSERGPVSVRHCDRCGGGFIGTESARYCGAICRREAATIQMRRRRA